MTDRIPYPRNYFDPHGDAPTNAQCTACGEWKDVADMDTCELELDLVHADKCPRCGAPLEERL